MYRIFVFWVLIILSKSLSGQYNIPEAGYVFDDSSVPRIDVLIDADSLDQLLAPANWFSNHEYPATFLFTRDGVTDTVEMVGFRLRGNTSRNAEKKSFKIDINAFRSGNYHGLTKLNLNGQHNDPTIMRSKLSFDLFNDAGVPASRSNHVNLYVNDEYFGIYLNTEHIDRRFVAKRFSNDGGNLWKCIWPSDLHYLGNNPNFYKEPMNGDRRAYDLKTNKDKDDYSALANFIDVLNNASSSTFKCRLEEVFDVENYLKVIVLDILISNWDGPIINKNNFYLYHNPSTDKITYIPYDLDNTFGIDWFNVDWANTDIYSWSDISGEYRPIYEKIMAVEEYRDKVSYYFKEYLSAYFGAAYVEEFIEYYLNLISDFRAIDTYAEADYGWGFDQFLNSFDEPSGGHVKYGLRDYITTRKASVNSMLNVRPIYPFLIDHEINWSEEEISFIFSAMDDISVNSVMIEYNIDGASSGQENLIPDINGKFHFTHENDEGETFYYRLIISDSDGNERFYPLCDFFEVGITYKPTPPIYINEFMASNTDYSSDEYGEFDDWLELYNRSGTYYSMNNFYLSDNPSNRTKWRFPNFVMEPTEYLIIWCDEDGHQGSLHSNFKLSKSGEFIGLYDASENYYAPIDTVTFPAQITDQSYGRLPNATGAFQFLPYVTQGYNNEASSNNSLDNQQVSVYPNPSKGSLNILLPPNISDANYRIIDMQGAVILSGTLSSEVSDLQLPELSEGLYVIQILSLSKLLHSQKLIVFK